MIRKNLLSASYVAIIAFFLVLGVQSCSDNRDNLHDEPEPQSEPEISEELPGDCVRFPVDDSRLPAKVAVEILDLHNKKRAEYCLPPLEWDNNLAKVAQWWAETSGADGPHSTLEDRLKKYKEFSGCTDCPESIGENMHWRQPWDFFEDSYVSGWLSEEEDSPGCNKGGAHYTQMVFELTTKVGCAAFIDSAGRLHFICEYDKWQGAHDPVFPTENCECGGIQEVKAIACD